MVEFDIKPMGFGTGNPSPTVCRKTSQWQRGGTFEIATACLASLAMTKRTGATPQASQ